MTITRESAKRLDILYLNELKKGDISCMSMSAFRDGKACKVISNEFQEVHGDIKGRLKYTKSPYYANVEFVSRKPYSQVIYLKSSQRHA